MDQAISSIEYVDGRPENGAIITIKNMREIPMPVTIEITTLNDNKIRKTFPVEVWKNNVSWKFLVETREAFKKVVIDPDFEYPDIDARNNYWYPEIQ